MLKKLCKTDTEIYEIRIVSSQPSFGDGARPTFLVNFVAFFSLVFSIMNRTPTIH